MKKLFEHKLAVFLIAATLIAAAFIGVFAALSSGERATAAEGVFVAAAEPGQSAATGIGGWLNNIFSYFGNIKALREENEALKHENIELDKQLRDTRGMEEENRQLREMLDLVKTENQLELVAVKIIAKDPSNWYSSFTINKGSNAGIIKGQPVITANEELVGQVYKVGSDWAEVITILDPESGVGSIIERSKDTGVLEGDFSLRYAGQCRLGYLSRDADIEKGDYVETSGMGGVYPKGLLIGKILDVNEDNTNMSKYAIVEPIVDIGKLSQVFVLTNSVEVIERKSDSNLSDTDNTDKSDSRGNNEDEDEGKVSATDKPSSSSATAKPTATTKATAKPTTVPTTDNRVSNSGTGGSGTVGNSENSDMNSVDGSELRE